MSGIFISYRRDDTQGFAGRLAHDLSRALGPEQVFSDIEIPFGSDFGEVLHRAIAASDALLVGNRSLSGVLCPPAPTRNNPSHIHQGGAGSDQGDSDQQQVAAA